MAHQNRISSKYRWIAGCFAALLVVFAVARQVRSQEVQPSITFNPRSYTSFQSVSSLNIDGKLNEESWKRAGWTKQFVDISGEEVSRPRFGTRVKMLWDKNYFYIAARLEEPHLWATLKKRDAVLFHENNFEVFIDPDGDTHNYYELEVNALGTYWDLLLPKPYRDGGQAVDAWDIRGLKVGVQTTGSLNDPSDTDSAWTVELALPWEVLKEAAPGGRPKHGEVWRVNFSRVQWQITPENGAYVKQSENEDNWVWSPQGIVNMHYPEMWGYVRFDNHPAGNPAQQSDFAGRRSQEQLKWYLRVLYYRQHAYWKEHKTYAKELEKLPEKSARKQAAADIDFSKWSKPAVYATDHTFEIFIEHLETGRRWYIREDGRIWER